VQSLLPLMLVPLLVWVAVWGYLWTLDGKVKRLQQEMLRVEQREEDDV
jgi:CcmD family protein